MNPEELQGLSPEKVYDRLKLVSDPGMHYEREDGEFYERIAAAVSPFDAEIERNT